MANSKSITLTRGKETRTVSSPDDVVRLKFEGWAVKSEPKASSGGSGSNSGGSGSGSSSTSVRSS